MSTIKLSSPYFITSRLLAGVKIGMGTVSLGYSSTPGREGRTRYEYFIDIDNEEGEPVQYWAQDLQSGAGGGDVRQGFGSLFAFLSSWAESCAYFDRAGDSEEEKREECDSFPLEIEDWARENSEEFDMLRNGLEPEEYCDCSGNGECEACQVVCPIQEDV